MANRLEYVVEVTTENFGESLILSNAGSTLDEVRRAAARWSKKHPYELAYVVRYRFGVATGHIVYSAGRISDRDGDFREPRTIGCAVHPLTRTERFTGDYADSFAA